MPKRRGASFGIPSTRHGRTRTRSTQDKGTAVIHWALRQRRGRPLLRPFSLRAELVQAPLKSLWFRHILSRQGEALWGRTTQLLLGGPEIRAWTIRSQGVGLSGDCYQMGYHLIGSELVDFLDADVACAAKVLSDKAFFRPSALRRGRQAPFLNAGRPAAGNRHVSGRTGIPSGLATIKGLSGETSKTGWGWRSSLLLHRR